MKNRNQTNLIFFNKLVLLGFLFFLACRTTSTISKTEQQYITVDSATAIVNDKNCELIIAPYREQKNATMNEIIGFSAMPMVKGEPESLLSNFVADCILYMANSKLRELKTDTAQICLLNSGGIRSTLPKGPLSRGKIFELLPFENQIVCLTMSGNKVMEMMHFVADKGGLPISGCSIVIKNNMATQVTIGNKTLDTTRNYHIITSDYLANGGDKMKFFAQPINTKVLDYKVRDAIIDYIKYLKQQNTMVSSALDKRVRYE